MTFLEPKYFFPESLLSDIRRDPKYNYEKVKLEFSIIHADVGTYSFQVKLYDSQVIDFVSEMKQIQSKQKIVFEKFFVCDYFQNKQQNLQITINKNNIPKIINTSLDSIINAPNGTFVMNLINDELFVVKAEKLGTNEGILNIFITLKNENEPNFFMNHKLYFLVTCRNCDIYRSAEIRKNGAFVPSQIPVCLLQPNYTISFYNIFGKPIFSITRTIQEVMQFKKAKKNIKFANGKRLVLEDYSEVSKKLMLTDYLDAGIKLAISLGIDFTASNGNPLNYGSLHSIQVNSPNAYEKAISSCGFIVGHYDYDQIYPVFGFGAILNFSYSNTTSTCFNLNFSEKPEIDKLDTVLKIYRDCIEQNKLTFSGPSYFSPIIRKVIDRINKNNLFEYHVFMILTTGVIDDLQQTIDLLVEACELPLSVIIVGIGNGDFTNMEKLDGDEALLSSSSGKKRIRDIVQFVPFNKYENDPEKLSMEVLAELPRQIVEFYYLKNLKIDQIKELAKNTKIYNKSKSQSYENYQFINNINNEKQNFPNIGFADLNDQSILVQIMSDVQDQPQKISIYNNQNISQGFQRSYTQGSSIPYQVQSFPNPSTIGSQINYQVYNNDINNATYDINQFNNSSQSGNNFSSTNQSSSNNSSYSNKINPFYAPSIPQDFDINNLPTLKSIPLDENNK